MKHTKSPPDGQCSDEILRAHGIRDKPETVEEVCKSFDVTRSIFYLTGTVLKFGSDELVELLEQGQIATYRAAEIAKKYPKSKQLAIAKRYPKGKHRRCSNLDKKQIAIEDANKLARLFARSSPFGRILFQDWLREDWPNQRNVEP